MIHGQKSTKSQLIRQSVTKCSNLRGIAKLPNMLRPGVGLRKHLSYLWGSLGTKSLSVNQRVSRNVAILGRLQILNMLRSSVKYHYLLYSHFITLCVQELEGARCTWSSVGSPPLIITNPAFAGHHHTISINLSGTPDQVAVQNILVIDAAVVPSTCRVHLEGEMARFARVVSVKSCVGFCFADVGK